MQTLTRLDHDSRQNIRINLQVQVIMVIKNAKKNKVTCNAAQFEGRNYSKRHKQNRPHMESNKHSAEHSQCRTFRRQLLNLAAFLELTHSFLPFTAQPHNFQHHEKIPNHQCRLSQYQSIESSIPANNILSGVSTVERYVSASIRKMHSLLFQ